MDDVFRIFQGITLGAVLVDVITHPEVAEFMGLQVQLYAENRCMRCRYKLDHPFVRHESPWWGHYEERNTFAPVVPGMDA